jgi:hypothetical protein
MSFPLFRRAAFVLIKGKRILAIEVYPGNSEADLSDLLKIQSRLGRNRRGSKSPEHPGRRPA